MNIPSYVGGATFLKSTRILRTKVYGCLNKYKLTASSWSLLGIVSDSNDGIRLSRVAEMIGVKAPLVTMMSDDLLEKGYLKRIPHHTDHRAKLLIITPKGKKFVRSIDKEMNELLYKLLDGLSEAEMKTYHKVLNTIIKNGEKDTRSK